MAIMHTSPLVQSGQKITKYAHQFFEYEPSRLILIHLKAKNFTTIWLEYIPTLELNPILSKIMLKPMFYAFLYGNLLSKTHNEKQNPGVVFELIWYFQFISDKMILMFQPWFLTTYLSTQFFNVFLENKQHIVQSFTT